MTRLIRVRVLRRKDVTRRGSFVVEADIRRSEELRADRLGPDEDDVVEDKPIVDPDRPLRSLGSF
jgi:hypothetical protein